MNTTNFIYISESYSNIDLFISNASRLYNIYYPDEAKPALQFITNQYNFYKSVIYKRYSGTKYLCWDNKELNDLIFENSTYNNRALHKAKRVFDRFFKYPVQMTFNFGEKMSIVNEFSNLNHLIPSIFSSLFTIDQFVTRGWKLFYLYPFKMQKLSDLINYYNNHKKIDNDLWLNVELWTRRLWFDPTLVSRNISWMDVVPLNMNQPHLLPERILYNKWHFYTNPNFYFYKDLIKPLNLKCTKTYINNIEYTETWERYYMYHGAYNKTFVFDFSVDWFGFDWTFSDSWYATRPREDVYNILWGNNEWLLGHIDHISDIFIGSTFGWNNHLIHNPTQEPGLFLYWYEHQGSIEIFLLDMFSYFFEWEVSVEDVFNHFAIGASRDYDAQVIDPLFITSKQDFIFKDIEKQFENDMWVYRVDNCYPLNGRFKGKTWTIDGEEFIHLI